MKIGPVEITRSRTVEAAASPVRAPREIGASGTVVQSGYLVSDEYNPDLRGDRALKTWARMRKSDASVREALQHIFAPVLNAEWDVEPASDDPLDLEVAEFVKRAYFDWPIDPFSQTLRQTLLYLAQGFQVFETVWQIVDAELAWADPSTKAEQSSPARQFLTWKRWAHRRPETIVKWNIHDGELESVVQLAYKDGSYDELSIPGDQLVVFTHEKEGDDFTGLSILRSAYKAWTLKEMVEKVGAQAIETQGLGLLNVYLPLSAVNDEVFTGKVEEILREVRAGGNTYAVWPFPMAQSVGTADTGGTVEWSGPPHGIPDFSNYLEYQRGEIKGNVLARFAELGHGSTGARATGDVQSEVWYAALHGVARYIGNVHAPKIRQLVLANYQTDRFPELVARGIESRSLQEFADANAKLVASGAVVPDASYKAFVREGIGAPDEDEPSAPEEKPLVEEDPTLEDPGGQ